MTRTPRPPRRLLALMIALALVATACGDSDDVANPIDGEGSQTASAAADPGSSTRRDIDPSGVEGEVFVSGSSTGSGYW